MRKVSYSSINNALSRFGALFLFLLRDHVPLPARGEQITVRLQAAGCTAFSIGADLDQLPFLNQQIDHGQDRRGLGIHGAADLGQA